MIWGLIIMSGLITFGMRFVFLTPAMPKELPPMALAAMRLVPLAVLWTIVVAEVFLKDGQLADFSHNERFYAAIGAAVIAWCTKSVIATIICGMSLYWLISYVF